MKYCTVPVRCYLHLEVCIPCFALLKRAFTKSMLGIFCRSGFLWLGTWFGLFRYGGYTLLADPEYSIEQLGKTLFMSRMQLYRKIKALTGDSPNHFIRTIRLNRAAQLLEKGYNVAEVTYQVVIASFLPLKSYE